MTIAYKEATNIPRVAYRVKEVAAAIGMTIAAVRQKVESGGIPHVKIGGRVFVPASFFREVGLEEPLRNHHANEERQESPGEYTVAEVAAALGMSIPNAYELTARGVIPAYRKGSRRLIPAAFFTETGLDAP